MTAPDTTAARAKLAEEIARLCQGYPGRLSIAWDELAEFVIEYHPQIVAALLAPAAALPEGWVAVPREPTEHMLAEGSTTSWMSPEVVRETWEDMLAASSEPPAPSAAGAWRTDMENAPRDGTDVLLRRVSRHGRKLPPIVAGFFDNGETEGWASFERENAWIADEITGWLPLPPDPPAAIPPGAETTEVGR